MSCNIRPFLLLLFFKAFEEKKKVVASVQKKPTLSNRLDVQFLL